MSFLDDYEPVEDRLRAFWSEHPNGRVLTSFIDGSGMQPGQVILFRADVWRDADGPSRPDASGFAHQRILTTPPLNKRGDPNESAPEWTSPFEVAETSAIGRALANLGYAAKGKRPSREEMHKTKGVSAGGESTTRRGAAGSPADTYSGEEKEQRDPAPSPSTDPSSEVREGEEPREVTDAPQVSQPPGVASPSRRPRCLHLKGTRTVDRAAGGRVEVCVECGVVIETVMLS
jgi:hypothetical protein